MQNILTEYHSSVVGGQGGIAKTKERICFQFYWPRMQIDIKQFVQQCVICQQAKLEYTLLAGLLQPSPIPSQV